MRVRTLLEETCKKSPNIDKNDVILAIMEVFNYENYTDYILNQDSEVTVPKQFYAIIKRLKKEEPIQYILGKSYFIDRVFNVTPAVLIPRPETEELVTFIIKEVKEKSGTIVDVGNGSGVIAISLAEKTDSKVYATEISKKALKVAKSNDTSGKVSFFEGDLLGPIIKEGIKVDYIVANLPYIKEDEVLESRVKDFEPNRALYLPKKNIFARLFKQVKKLNIGKEGLSIYLEIGTNQSSEISSLARKIFGESVTIEIVKDMQNKNRFIFIRGIYGN